MDIAGLKLWKNIIQTLYKTSFENITWFPTISETYSKMYQKNPEICDSAKKGF